MNIVRQLIWDDGNVEHIAYHAITPQEVEEVCHSNPVVRRTRQKRLLVIGRTIAGEYLTVVLDPGGKRHFLPGDRSSCQPCRAALLSKAKGR